MPDLKVYLHAAAYDVSVWPDEMRDDPASAMDADTWKITVEYRGLGKWAVLRGPWCLGADGGWDVEPRPSSRDDDWLEAHRFPVDEALKLARHHAPKVTINGMTALEVLARHQGDQ